MIPAENQIEEIEISFSQLTFWQRFKIISYILLGRIIVFEPIENVSKTVVQEQPTSPKDEEK